MQHDSLRILRRQQYRLVGPGMHSAVKLCHWMRQKLLHGRPCYKEDFYGIRCHRCLQMTPAVSSCNHSCLFCWRFHPEGGERLPLGDDPEPIVEEAIEAQRQLISGFKGDGRCDRVLFKEAQEPNQAAISLSGEPALYPALGGLIDVLKRRGFTTFLVTNGTLPRALERLDPLPTQLYVTVAAPNEEVYRRLCVPRTPNGWRLLNETLGLLPSLDTRTVIRHTLVEGWNLGWEDEYARLDALARPMFIEPKGYVFVGDSRQNMTVRNMPSHERVRLFSSRIAKALSGYDIIAERVDSRVVTLARDGARPKIISN
ncbi:MAG: 4-demethylwyosine synthase TYW1 [Euryarchaeota archaeon]|nr:4-demethylwyosine synthase TYW1 [Euryarchaeota archaeon]